MLKPLTFGIVLISSLCVPAFQAAHAGAKSWAKYYDDQLPPTAFKSFDLLILDHHYHPPLKPLLAEGKTLIAYLNAGEVEERESFFKDVKKEGLLIKENARWEKSHFVDVRDQRWQRRIIDKLIPPILAKGFQGIFVDTLDNAIGLEEEDPEKYKGMQDAAVTLVKKIRARYPKILIVINRAFKILPEIGGIIDMVQAESIYTSYDMKKKTYGLNDPKTYQAELKFLKQFKAKFPKVRILSLEYAEANDKEKIKEIYRTQRSNGFEPYVSVIQLDRIIEEPK